MPQPGADWPDSGRLGSTRLCSERYGSTPALSRPHSKLAVYASNGDLRAQLPSYSSLDRRLLSRPPPPPPPPPRHLSVGGGLTSSGARAGSLDSGSPTLSTSSGNSDRVSPGWGFEEAELAALRLTAQRNEQALVRAHRDKERAWERELRRLQAAHDTRMRGAAQRAQLDQTSQAADELRAQVTALRAQLETAERSLREKTADVAQLSAQLCDMQTSAARARVEMSREREVWAGEKERVLRYQRQLQRNYVIMFRRARALDERAALAANAQAQAADADAGQ